MNICAKNGWKPDLVEGRVPGLELWRLELEPLSRELWRSAAPTTAFTAAVLGSVYAAGGGKASNTPAPAA